MALEVRWPWRSDGLGGPMAFPLCQHDRVRSGSSSGLLTGGERPRASAFASLRPSRSPRHAPGHAPSFRCRPIPLVRVVALSAGSRSRLRMVGGPRSTVLLHPKLHAVPSDVKRLVPYHPVVIGPRLLHLDGVDLQQESLLAVIPDPDAITAADPPGSRPLGQGVHTDHRTSCREPAVYARRGLSLLRTSPTRGACGLSY